MSASWVLAARGAGCAAVARVCTDLVWGALEVWGTLDLFWGTLEVVWGSLEVWGSAGLPGNLAAGNLALENSSRALLCGTADLPGNVAAAPPRRWRESDSWWDRHHLLQTEATAAPWLTMTLTMS